MNDAKVLQLFRLYAHLENAEPFRDLADSAISAVRAELRPDADENDSRLCEYAAAYANLLYCNMRAAAGSLPTFAGTVSGGKAADTQYLLAKELLRHYRAAAVNLLRDDAFFFQAV